MPSLIGHVGPRCPGGQKMTSNISIAFTDADYQTLQRMALAGGTTSVSGYARLIIKRHLSHGVPINVVTEQAISNEGR